MPIAGSTRVGSSAGVPTLANVSMPSANTEYSYAFPTGTSKFTIRNRNNGLLQFAFTSGQTNTVFFTLPSGVPYCEDGISAGSVTIYFESPKPSQTLEIISWS